MSSAPTARSRIFISYRRQDSELAEGRLAADLRRSFPPEQVFDDVTSIAPGADFQEALEQALQTCAAVLVAIGPHWLTARDAQGRRRLELADDWVRHEVTESLKDRHVRVFPVLLDGASMPATDDLPESIRALTRRQAFSLTTRHWAKDVEELVGHLRRVPGLGQAPIPAQDPPAREQQPVAQWSDLPRTAAPPRVFDAREALADRAVPLAPVETQDVTPSRSIPWKAGIGIAAAVLAGVIIYGGITEREGPPPPPPSPPSPTREAAPLEPVAPIPAGEQATPATVTRPTGATLKPGSVFRDCTDCPEMVVIRAGSFMMGSRSDEKERDSNEGPQHRVAIAHSFAVGKYEVTFQEWDACVGGGGCQHRPPDNGWGRGRQPVINVSWEDAQAYVRWLSKETGKTYRLLSEAEWEYAARAGSTTRYPWGDNPGNNQATFDGSGSRWSGKQPAPVGSFTGNAFGLYDTIGNVWEWTRDCWSESYEGAPADGSAWEGGDCGRRVVRGGSWHYGSRNARVVYRYGVGPGNRDDDLGFRLARTL